MRFIGWFLLGTISLAGTSPLLAFARCVESLPQHKPSQPPWTRIFSK